MAAPLLHSTRGILDSAATLGQERMMTETAMLNDDPAEFLTQAIALREAQTLVEADVLLSRAVAAAPDHAALAFAHAQTRFELGHDAAALLASAQALQPGNLDLIRNRAAAMAAEGDLLGAVHLLDQTLAAHPDWLDGHKALATLRWTRGDQLGFAASYAAACTTLPRHRELWLGWFRAVAQTRDWRACLAILDAAERALGELPALLVCRLFVASESGDAATADALFARTQALQGETINLCRIRHALRQHRPEQVEAVAIPWLLTRSAPVYWPYLSLAWRQRDDARHLWLDRPDIAIGSREIGLTGAELAELAAVLRTLHTMQHPYIEQSVRGGTQTDRSVILRHEPIIQRTRAAMTATIRDFIAQLPAHEQGHPLLGTPRSQLLIEGSWSVRLLQQGYNVPHTHPLGWLSCVLYVAIPDAGQIGRAPAGQIGFGMPPADLGLTLPAYRYLEPKAGRIALFGSTMWHGTVPFDDGERLVIALDIRPPRF